MTLIKKGIRLEKRSSIKFDLAWLGDSNYVVSAESRSSRSIASAAGLFSSIIPLKYKKNHESYGRFLALINLLFKWLFCFQTFFFRLSTTTQGIASSSAFLKYQMYLLNVIGSVHIFLVPNNMDFISLYYLRDICFRPCGQANRSFPLSWYIRKRCNWMRNPRNV